MASLPFFIPDFNLLNCKLDNFTFLPHRIFLDLEALRHFFPLGFLDLEVLGHLELYYVSMCQTVLIFPNIYIIHKRELKHFELQQVLNYFKYFLIYILRHFVSKSDKKNYIRSLCQYVLISPICIH